MTSFQPWDVFERFGSQIRFRSDNCAIPAHKGLAFDDEFKPRILRRWRTKITF